MKTALHRKRVRYILQHGERYVRGGLVVCVLKPDTPSNHSGRFAVLISKKAVKGAVLRNRLRRVLREIVTSSRMCADVVVLCRRECGSETEVREYLQVLLDEVFGV